MNMKGCLFLVTLLGTTTLMGGCSSLSLTGQSAPTQASNGGTSIGQASFASKMYSTIFLQPVPPSENVVFLEGHNTSSAQTAHFRKYVAAKLERDGYTITTNPNAAEYMLMYNLRYLARTSHSETLAGAVAGGYGGAVLAGVAGGGVGEIVGGGLVGAAVGGLVGHFLSSRKFMMIVDIQVEQRNTTAQNSSTTTASEGLGNTTTSTGSFSGWQIFRDRVASMAQGRRLHFSYVQPALCKIMAAEIAGIF